jgi:hypothetical protein
MVNVFSRLEIEPQELACIRMLGALSPLNFQLGIFTKKQMFNKKCTEKIRSNK